MAAKRKRFRGSPPTYYRSLCRSLAAQHELLDTALATVTSDPLRRWIDHQLAAIAPSEP